MGLNNYRMIPTALLETNAGQVPGLPKNPRMISGEMFGRLKRSIQDAPEMLEMRSLVAVRHGEGLVVVCGNMRLEACRELGYTELPCFVLPEDTPVEKLREYAIKDNLPYGDTDWELISTEWDTAELEEWGLDLPDSWGEGGPAGEGTEGYSRSIVAPTYEPGEVFLTVNYVRLSQAATQGNRGGMTELYLDSGTYLKSFFPVMYHPSGVKVSMMGVKEKRLHHHINWNRTAPRIIAERYRKK